MKNFCRKKIKNLCSVVHSIHVLKTHTRAFHLIWLPPHELACNQLANKSSNGCLNPWKMMNVFVLFVGISFRLPAFILVMMSMSMSMECVAVTLPYNAIRYNTLRCYIYIRGDVDDVKCWWSCVGSTWVMWCKIIHSRVDNLHFLHQKSNRCCLGVIYANCIALPTF